MIKVGVAGASTRVAGELFRILINHPDVDIITAFAPGFGGRRVCDIHHGLIGELSLTFSEKLDPLGIDMLFVCESTPQTDEIIANPVLSSNLRIVDLTSDHSEDYNIHDMVYGLSEIYRKSLVRGATRAIVPSPVAAMSLICLFPLGLHSLVNENLTIEADGPEDLGDDTILRRAEKEIASHLSYVQPSFPGDVRIIFSPSSHNRSVRIAFSLKCPLPIEEITRIFNETYDDHNFTFAVGGPVHTREISGTNKCIVALFKPDSETLRVDAVADCRMRGGAGEAVHLMNLLFGLHERTGLMLKADKY